MTKVKLVLHTRYVDERGGLVEMKAYDVPKTTMSARAIIGITDPTRRLTALSLLIG